MKSADSGIDVLVDSASALGEDSNIARVTPASTPGVSNDPVGVAVFCAIANSGNCMVEG